MSENKKRYLLTGGGTGGHVYPAIAIADEIRRREPDATFLYVGVKGKAEERIVPARGYPLEFVTSRGWPGAKPGPALFLFALSLGWGVIRSIGILRKFKPDVIIATGGFVSAPIMLAWVLLKRLKLTTAKAFVHEQNLVPGRLNRLVGKLATRVGVSFEESRRFFPNAQWVGYPARKEINKENREQARKELNLPSNAKVLLIFGGSQGSRSINRAVIDGLDKLLEDENVYVIHGVGRYRGQGYNPVEDTQTRLAKRTLRGILLKRYEMHEYLDPIERYYAAADLVICRAGAGSLTEVALCGLPALIVPKANLPGDHQVQNAQALVTKGAGQVIYEQTLQSDEGLIDAVDGAQLAQQALSLLNEPEARNTMSTAMKDVADDDALDRIADCVQQVIAGTLPELPPLPERDTSRPALSEMTGGGLVSYLSRHGMESLLPDEISYLTYRTDGYLAQTSWQSRNIGVKLVGLLKLESRLDLLLFVLNDQTPAVWWHRWAGGDRKQVGFIRRNGVTSLRQVGVWNAQVRDTLLATAKDNYYEVRTQTARTFVAFGEQIESDEAVLAALDTLCEDSSFEVKIAAIRTLAQVDKRPSSYQQLKSLFRHPNWRVREAVAYCLMCWVERGILASSKVKQDMEQLLVTSSGFVPHFQLREQIRQLSQALEKI